MAALNFHLNDTLNFPPLPKPYMEIKQHQRKPRKRNTKHNNEDDDNNSRTCIDDLNDTLLEVIFICFPWRQLAPCKRVSKRWNSIISNPDFLRLLPLEHSPFTLYLSRTRYPQYGALASFLVTEHPYFRGHELCLDFLPGDYHYDNPNYLNIVANHKDLFVTYRTLNHEESAYYIANPFTKQFIVVPLTQTEAMDNLSLDINFPEYVWPECRAVGFAGVVEGVSTPGVINLYAYNDGFRIVRIAGRYNEVLQIYSSKTGRWRSYPLNNTRFHLRSSKMAVTLNNKIFFQGSPKIVVIDPFGDDIASPRLLDLPTRSEGSVLGVSRNRLHIAKLKHYSINPYPSIKVWELEDHKKANFKLLFKLPLKPSIFYNILSPNVHIFPKFSDWYSTKELICCHPNDPHVVYFSNHATVYRCDVVKQRTKVMAHCVEDWHERLVFIHPFVKP